MVQFLLQSNIFQARNPVKKEVKYYAELLSQLKDEETMGEEEHISTRTEGPTADQSNGEGSSHMFTGPAAEEGFIRRHRDFYKCYGEHQELSQYF